ncbi:MAG: MASE1 domain-containing protein [Bacteroidota bacterium]
MVKNIPFFSIRNIALILVVASLYYLSARAGLLLAFENTNVTPVWPPSGIALAAILLLGCNTWPGIMLGAFTANLVVFLSNGTTDMITALGVSAFISIGNTLSSIAGYYLLKKLEEEVVEFEKVKHVLQFLSAALIMCLISCTIGSTAICFADIISWNYYPVIWFTWWLGDVSGVIIATPLLLLWVKYLDFKWQWSTKIIQAVLLFGLVFFASGFIFFDWLKLDPAFIKPYLILPFLLWSVFYFNQRILVTIIAISSVVAIAGTVNGNGPFASEVLNNSLLALQTYVVIVSFTIITVRAAINERKYSEEVLKEAHQELMLIAKERKEELSHYQKRIENIFNAILQYTLLDFSHKTTISEKADEIDAIAAGLNTLREELEHYVKELQESEERFRVLVESIKDYAIIMLDTDGNIESWNAGAESIEGYASEEIIGKHISVFYTTEEIEHDEPKNNLNKARATGHFESEALRVRKNGSEFWADVIITALYDENKKLRGFVKITRDITERKNAEIELNKKSEELARSNAELEQFAYVASHDLQEPLRMVNSYVQLLASRYKDKLDKDANDFIEFAVDGSTRMRTLIQSLLEYSRVNRIKPFEKIDVNEIINEVMHDLKDSIEKTHAIIKVDKLPVITGDAVLIGQLFQNLIFNAIKFKGPHDPEIIISGKKQNREYLFSIKDNGIGIQKEYSEKIFVIFQRLHSKEKYPGTGIGLAICKKIVERHGGKIWVESELGKGTTFYFTIKS